MMSTGWISISIVRAPRGSRHETSGSGGMKEVLERRDITVEDEQLESDKGTSGEKRE